MRLGTIGLVAIPALAATALACQVLVKLSWKDAGSDDAGPEAAPPIVGPPPEEVCGALKNFHPPPQSDAGGDVSLTFAFGYGAFDPPEPARVHSDMPLCPNVGFDLDGRSTCYDDAGNRRSLSECDAEADAADCPFGSSCTPRPGTTNDLCDQPGGEDNSLGAAMARLPAIPAVEIGDVNLVSFLRNGQGNLLLTISGYNGEPDDAQVIITTFRSTGIVGETAVVPDAALPDGGPRTAAPVWDGRSLRAWYVDPLTSDSPSGTPVPRFFRNAYVRNYVLVVTDLRTSFPGGIDMDITDAILIGQLRKNGDRWDLVRGRFGGSVDTNAVMRSAGEVPIHFGGKDQSICENQTFLELLKENICGAADLGEGPCTAGSIGVGFYGVPAIIGPVRARLRPKVSCDAGAAACY